MSMEISKTPEALGAEIRSLTTQARCMTVYFGVEIGRRLMAAKSMVPYGSWGEWLKKETEFSQSTATRFMKVFEEYGADQIGIFGAVVESSTLQNLSISNALRLLAVPAEEREEFAAEVDAEHISVRELEKAIAERDAANKRADIAEAKRSMEAEAAEKYKTSAEKNMKELDAENQALNAKVAELESRPVEVAVQRDEKAIKDAADEAKKKADSAWSKKIDKVLADLSAAQAQKAELEKELAEAKKPTGDEGKAAELQEKIERLEKQIKTSAPEVQAVKFRLSALQTAYRELMDAIGKVENDETAGKLRGAVLAQLGAWMEG